MDERHDPPWTHGVFVGIRELRPIADLADDVTAPSDADAEPGR